MLESIDNPEVTIGENVTLNLNSNTVTDAYIIVTAEVIVKNGSVKNTNEDYPLVVQDGGKLTVEELAIEASKSDRAIWVRENSSLIFNSGSILSTKGDNSNVTNNISAITMSKDSNVTVNGGTITVDTPNNKAYGIFGNYENADLTINGGKISTSGSGHNYGVWVDGDVIMTDGEIVTNEKGYGYSSGIRYGNNHAIHCQLGDVTISGGTITTNGSSGYAVSVGRSYSPANQTITISGGTFTNNLSEVETTTGNHSAPELIYTNSANTTTAAISGGTFTGYNMNSVEEYLAEDFNLVETEDGSYIVANANVAKIGDTYYTSLNEAILAVEDGGTIYVLLGAEISETVHPHNGDSQHSLEKSFSIIGEGSPSDNNPVLKGGMVIGYNDCHTHDNTIIIEKLHFIGKGLSVNDEKNVVIKDCVFTNIQGDAIATMDQTYSDMGGTQHNGSLLIEGNYIDGATGIGILADDAYDVTITGNHIYNTGHNAIQLVINETTSNARPINDGTVIITDNVINNWDANNDSEGGRALRANFGKNNDDVNKSFTFTGNLMLKEKWADNPADPNFVKVTYTTEGIVASDLSRNYWNSAEPDFDVILGGEINNGNYADLVENYYTDEAMQNLVNVVVAVAQIGETKYETFEAALAALKDDETLTLLQDITITETIVLTDNNITFDGNGKTITVDVPHGGRAIDVPEVANNANVTNVTFKELTINNTEGNYLERVINYNTGGTLTIENVTIGGYPATYAINLPADSDNSKVSINDSNITAKIALNVWGENTIITADNSNFTSIDNSTAEDYAAIVLNNDGTISAEGSIVTINGGSIIALDENEEESVAVSNAAYDSYINIDTETTTVVGEIKNVVAVILGYPNDIFYSCYTLQEAVDENSVNGKTVKIIRDITLTERVDIAADKNFTLDLNGKTISGEFVDDYGIIYVKKGADLTVEDSSGKGAITSKVTHAIGNYGNVVIKGGSLNGGTDPDYGQQAALYNFYYNADYYGTATINGGSLNCILNCGVLNVNNGKTERLDNSGALTVEGGTITNLIGRDGSDASDVPNAGIMNVSSATLQDITVLGILNLNSIAESTEINSIELAGNGQIYNEVAIPATIKKHIAGTPGNAGTRRGWSSLSVPFIGNETECSFEQNVVEVLYRYEEDGPFWSSYHSGAFNLEQGRGYLYSHEQVEPREISFHGTISADDKITYTLSYTDKFLFTNEAWGIVGGQDNPLAGFNLVGNPFAHNIKFSHLSDEKDALADGYYVVSEEGGWIAKTGLEDEVIAPMSAVLVKTSELSVLTFSRKATRETRKADNGILAINVNNGEYSDIAYASFNEGLGLDKINHSNEDIPMVFIPQNGTNYAIATMSKDVTEIPVSFRPMTMGQYTISVSAQQCEFEELYLVDKFNGEVIDILNNDYTFLATSNDAADRFVIRMSEKESENNISDSFIYINNDELIIDNVDGQAQVSIYDVLGRPVASYDFNGSSNISTSTFADGVYIIRVSNDKGVKVQKIIID